MAHQADIDAVTGPGKRVHLKLQEVKEIGFNFDKKVITVVTGDGNYGTYDLEKTTVVEFKRDGEDFTMIVKKNEEEIAKDEKKDNKQEWEKGYDRDKKELKDGPKAGTTGHK